MSAGIFSIRIFLQSFYFLIYTFQKLINSLLLKIFFPPFILRFLYYPEDIFLHILLEFLPSVYSLVHSCRRSSHGNQSAILLANST